MIKALRSNDSVSQSLLDGPAHGLRQLPSPARQLHYVSLAALGGGNPELAERTAMETLLAEVNGRQRTVHGQANCAQFAAALRRGETDGMLAASRRLAEREEFALSKVRG
ncbi:MAG: hypothetical protein ABIP41_01830 [Croceibacterium sp.]